MATDLSGRLQFRLLGPLEVWRDGEPLALGGGRQRALLALLLVHVNEPVAVEALVEALFGEQRSEGTVNAVRVAVSRLRHLLEADDENGVLQTRPGGYTLSAAPEQVDVAIFERLLRDGRERLAVGDAVSAAAWLREGLALWHGGALADLVGVEHLQAEIRRLEELRLVAVMERIEADLALGAADELISELEVLIAVDPLRERPRGQLMRALYRAGRQTDALAVYRELNGSLRDELGLEPSRALKELERSILQHDAALEPSPRADPATGSLPMPATPFLGRPRELAEVTALLRDADRRLVTLTGVGGSGKTRLALQAAQACAHEHQRGAWFVGFADVTDPGLIAPAICQALGLAEQPDLTPAQRLEGYLRDRELLFVLDNLEQLTTGVGVLGELLAGCPGLRMLVTSREPLRLAGEQQYEVPVLDREDAIELFVARAGAVAPNLVIERETAAAVCERLDRLPLAIELAAARTKVLSPAEILDRLERRLPVLASGPRDAPQRQRTLQATIDWSYELLTEKEQRLFARLAVFAGGCTLQAAEAVCDGKLDTLGALVDRSLVRAGSGRYWMLQTLRECALDKLAQSGDDDDVRRRHAQWFVELLHAHGLDTFNDPDMGRMHVLRAAEPENFRAALEWAERAEEIETVARLAAPLTMLWCDEGRLSEADRWLGVVRERSDEYPLALQAWVLTAAREIAWARGAYHEAADLCEQALALYRELGDVTGIVIETSRQAGSEVHLGDLPRARALMEEALALAREHELNRWLPTILINLADIEVAEGRLDQARALCEEALTLAPRGVPSSGVAVRINLALIANLERCHTDAAEVAQEALNRAVRIGYLNGSASAALTLAWSLAELQQPERAALLLGTALEFFRHTGTAMQWSDTVCERAVRDALRAQLDERALYALVEDGRAMTLEQAVQKECRDAEQRA